MCNCTYVLIQGVMKDHMELDKMANNRVSSRPTQKRNEENPNKNTGKDQPSSKETLETAVDRKTRTRPGVNGAGTG